MLVGSFRPTRLRPFRPKAREAERTLKRGSRLRRRKVSRLCPRRKRSRNRFYPSCVYTVALAIT